MMKYGSITTEEVFLNGEIHHANQWIKESLEIPDKEHLLTEMLETIDMIIGNQTTHVDVTIKRNKAGQIMLTRKHRVQ